MHHCERLAPGNIHPFHHPSPEQQQHCSRLVCCAQQAGWNDAKKYWLVRNSFGSGFADGGYFRVRRCCTM
jgi:hypothetical protein